MVAVLQPLKNHKPIAIDRAVILVGRGEDCDVVINGSKKISRKHCCLVHSDEVFLIRDLGSTNGVWVNGKRIDRESPMEDGDRVAIGDVKFRFYPNGLRQAERQAANSKLAEAGVEILTPDASDADLLMADDLVMVEDVVEVVDDDLLDDDLVDDVDIDLIDEPELVEEVPPAPPGRKPKGTPFREEIESEPVIDLDDSFADEDIIEDVDIIPFDDE